LFVLRPGADRHPAARLHPADPGVAAHGLRPVDRAGAGPAGGARGAGRGAGHPVRRRPPEHRDAARRPRPHPAGRASIPARSPGRRRSLLLPAPREVRTARTGAGRPHAPRRGPDPVTAPAPRRRRPSLPSSRRRSAPAREGTMLEELNVAGLGVIDEASLELSPGLNVLTGETGAGKTMVTLALGLVLGGRGGADLVGQGRDRLSVEARFSVADPPPEHLAEWAEDGEVILARAVRADGKGTARAGGHLTSVSTLTSVGEGMVEIHGQRQTDRLLGTDAQTSFLDRYAGDGHERTLAEHRDAFSQLRAARSRLERLERESRERERERDLLAYQIREIESAALRPGEPEELESEESRLAHAERIIDLTGGAQSALAEDGAAVDRLREAAVALGAVAGRHPAAEAP